MNTLIEFHLLGMPLALLDEARAHQEALMRELAILDVAGRQAGCGEPERLLDLAADIRSRYAAFSAAPTRALAEARAAGTATVDLLVVLPRHAGRTAREFRDLLHRIDDMCARGELLTTPAPAGTVRIRDWYLTELENQAAGRPPVPYPG